VLNILSRGLAYAQSTDCGNHVLHVPLLAPNFGDFSVADDEAGVRLFDGPGRLWKRRASTISYSSLNSLRVMDRSRAASRTPLCANSMILDATKRVAGSSLSRRPSSAHTPHDRHGADRFGVEG
jgi:hypothetical protein